MITEFGIGKANQYSHFSPHNRGTRGQMIYKATPKAGEIVGVLSVKEDEGLMCMTSPRTDNQS